MPPQHASLTTARWSEFTLDQRILMIANEMHRCAKLFAPEDRARLQSGYERVLRLTDLTVSCRPRPALLRELLRWRDLVAALYVGEAPAPAAHRAAFEVLLRFTPVAARQIPHVLGPA
ncbi:MAG: hypothetical protein ABSG61_08825 [Gemmatimonadales bacterium]|jgi:hypothetical protein